MEKPRGNIRVQVDPSNPGHFFAGCGLLELADRLFGEAEGWFEGDRFLLSTHGSLPSILQSLATAVAEEVTRLENGLEVKPLIAPVKLAFNGDRPFEFCLDAWMTVKSDKSSASVVANRPWNFWSGQQTSFGIWCSLQRAFEEQLPSLLLKELTALFTYKTPLTGRFGFDPEAAWKPLDVGFSPNEQGMGVASSPAVELLAAVGIQRFRPSVAADTMSFLYATWCDPLPPVIAGAAASGVTAFGTSTLFQGQVISRGSYAALGRSTLVRGESHD